MTRDGNFHPEVQVPCYYCLEPRVFSGQGLEDLFNFGAGRVEAAMDDFGAGRFEAGIESQGLESLEPKLSIQEISAGCLDSVLPASRCPARR